MCKTERRGGQIDLEAADCVLALGGFKREFRVEELEGWILGTQRLMLGDYMV